MTKVNLYLLVECGDRLPRSALVDGCGKPGWNAGCENGGIPYIPAANGYIPAPNSDCVAYKEAAAVRETLPGNILTALLFFNLLNCMTV